ncbi:MAG: adenosylmethionine--8-amino-7-oxononanoate transaminase [Flammeovirgaceae bacterium]
MTNDVRTSTQQTTIDLQFDKEHIWHPYTSMIDPLPVFPVRSAAGVHIQLEDGRKLVDGMASWWTAIHGYNHPVLNEAVQQQVQKMAHVMFGGLTHEPAVALAKLLVKLTPEPLEKVFFSDSGSVSVEVSMKMAMQYWQSQGYQQKAKFLTIKSGYHGDTFHAMSVCDPVNGMHHLFKHSLPINFFADAPQSKFGAPLAAGDLDSISTLIQENHHTLAAVILEPIVQGAGGMRFYSAAYLQALRKLCDQYDILLIFDEIATGFGRTGSLFACELANVVPDILCLGKAMTGGYLTLAATLASRKVADGISRGEAKVFMHGPTFMGNPLACAVAVASIQLLLKSPWQAQVKAIEQQLQQDLLPLAQHDRVKDARVLGAIGVIEAQQAVNMAYIQQQFVEMGVWIRPFGKLIYIMPPFIINPPDLSKLTKAMTLILDDDQAFMA